MIQKLVIDSGIAIKWFVDEPDSESAKLSLDGFKLGKYEFFAPDLIYSEVGNIFWKKVTFDGFKVADAEFAIESFKEIPILTVASLSLFDAAFTIATKHNRTFYDSLYLALGERMGCPFITADTRLFNSLKSSFHNIALLSNWSE
ncbi:MAG: type II toxin-antitoxin system VapC family toxin [Pyrinomonadaceae bacterium]